MLGHRKLTGTDYLDILKRRRWLIALPTLVVPIIAIVVSFLIPPQYVSQTLVIIQEQQVSSKIADAVVTSSLDSRLASMKEQILSRSRIQPIIERYNLFSSKTSSMDERVDQTRKAILVKPIRSDIATRTSGLPGFFITFTANDARTAQLVCADITSLFVTANLQSREAHAENTADFLKGQLDDAKRSLDEQDAKLAAFQREHFGKLPGEEIPNMNMLSSLNTQLEAATQALAQMQQQKAYQESMLSQLVQTQPAPPTAGSIAQAPPAEQMELQTLLNQEADLTAHYTPNHPDVIAVKRKIADLRRKMAQSAPQSASGSPIGSPARPSDSLSVQQLRAQLRSAEIGIMAKKREQESLQGRIAEYQNRIESSPLVAAQYKDMTRDNETAQKFYDDLLTKMNGAKLAGDLERRQQGEQFTVMDMANLPESPTFPQRWMFAVGGLVFGLILGLALTAFLEYKDTALRTEQDVWAFTRLPTLAVIAYSGDIQLSSGKPGMLGRIKRLFRQKESEPVEALGKAHS